MPSACRDLFEYALRQVTVDDVAHFVPNDPGGANYFREFTAILSSGLAPTASHFDITETVSMTQWGDAGRERDPVRFRRFRIFTNAVAVAICTGPEGPNDHMPPNYIGVRLLDDAHALQDSQLLRLLSPAFAELHQRIAGAGWLVQEAPFFLLGQLVLAFMGHAPSADVDRLCELLVAEEYLHLGPFTEDFLWGCTVFNQLHDRWKHFVELSFPIHSDNSSIVLLRDALLPPPTNIG